MYKYIMALALLLIPTSALAGEDIPGWTWLSESDTGSINYARTQDLLAGRSHQTSARLWLMTDTSNDASVDWYSMRVLYRVNCVTRAYMDVQYSAFGKNGRHIDTWAPNKPTIAYAIPGSTMEYALDLLCVDPDYSSEDTF